MIETLNALYHYSHAGLTFLFIGQHCESQCYAICFCLFYSSLLHNVCINGTFLHSLLQVLDCLLVLKPLFRMVGFTMCYALIYACLCKSSECVCLHLSVIEDVVVVETSCVVTCEIFCLVVVFVAG